jgi:hypothetical protein
VAQLIRTKESRLKAVSDFGPDYWIRQAKLIRSAYADTP